MRTVRIATLFIATVVLVSAAPVTNVTRSADMDHGLSDEWLRRWQQPPMVDRPLQIIHAVSAARANPAGMRYYKNLGLGGVVCNVASDDYLVSDDNWKTLVAAVEACRQLGVVVWIYDEDGYPSGAAGGRVLEEKPAYEALALAFDSERPDPFVVRPAYEHTHASNNFFKARRYPNLIDDRATRSFIHNTHRRYRMYLEPYFGNTIRAVFTDEPSLIAVDLGQLPDDVRRRVPVVDAVDPTVKPLPCVPWSYDILQQYQTRYGEDLMPHRRCLFGGNKQIDRQVRRQFWALVSDLIADRYFASIRTWCSERHIASSGHSLWEEQPLHHVPLEGNGLKVLSKMDIPGLDMLSSDPKTVVRTGWMTAAMPASAAMLTGRRRVMTEVSDFIQKMAGGGPASLADMQATAAWQAAWGVTDFTLYYGPADRSDEDYRAYCRYVGRLNAILKRARQAPEVLLYYPIFDLWAEYRPVTGQLKVDSQSQLAQRIVGSFMQLGGLLQRSQVPFALIDHEMLTGADLADDGRMTLGEHRFNAILLPDGVKLPEPAATVVQRFRQRGGRVISHQRDAAPLESTLR